MRTGVPSNEKTVFPVRIDLQGIPCEPYRVWVCSVSRQVVLKISTVKEFHHILLTGSSQVVKKAKNLSTQFMNDPLAFAATRGKVDFSCLVMSYCSQQIKCKKKPLGRIILTALTRLENTTSWTNKCQASFFLHLATRLIQNWRFQHFTYISKHIHGLQKHDD